LSVTVSPRLVFPSPMPTGVEHKSWPMLSQTNALCFLLRCRQALSTSKRLKLPTEAMVFPSPMPTGVEHLGLVIVQLTIYGGDGTAQKRKFYDQPRAFSDLLGDMSVDALTYFGPAPSGGLAAFLHEPRYAHAESLAALGSAAFMPERSAQEFSTYDGILASDPGFAIVRYWHANQENSVAPDPAALLQQTNQSIQARPEIMPLNAIAARRYIDAGLQSEYLRCLEHAYQLAGPDNPFVLAHRLETGEYLGLSRADILRKGLEDAAKYPNAHYLLEELAYSFMNPGEGTPDYEMAASLFLADEDNLYLPGTGEKYDSQLRLAQACVRIGRSDIAAEVLGGGGQDQPQYNLQVRLQALCFSRHFADVLALYHQITPPADEQSVRAVLPAVAFAAAVLKKTTELDALLKDHHDALQAAGILALIQGYRDMAEGVPVDVSRLQGLGSRLTPDLRWNLLLVTEADSLGAQERSMNLAHLFVWNYPEDRLGWMIMDGYQRRDAGFDGAAFYDYLDWLHGDDP
jgi:hypothetical protein